jgi:hypothetical protein
MSSRRFFLLKKVLPDMDRVVASPRRTIPMRSPFLPIHDAAFTSQAKAASRFTKVGLFLLSLVVLASGTARLNGATITVFSANDSGAGTLRQAIFDASPGDTINFAIPWQFPTSAHEIQLSSELLIAKSLTINGPADKLAVQAGLGQGYRCFHIAASVSVTIVGLTISPTGSGCIPCSGGGGILNAGTLTIENCTIAGNLPPSGSDGGGILNTGTLAIVSSTISGNAVYGNFHGSIGGGIANLNGGTLTITNSTISGNIVSEGGPGTPYCGGGIFTDSGSTTSARSTIIALNTGQGPDVCGPLTSQGFNLVGNNADSIITPAQASDLIGTSAAPIDPLLGPLQYNGGLTFTRALQSTSPAVNAGDPNAPARDQRGFLRAGVSDVGAFEFGGTVPVSLANISTRLRVESGDNVLIGGFIITGAQPKKVIVRAIGPSLSLPGVLADPILELRNSSGGLIAVNDNWRSDQEAEIIATTIPPSNDLESAIVATLPANNAAYTAIVRGVNNGTGTGVVEAYDLNRTVESKLGNISTRGLVQTGDNVLIAGTIVVGQDSQKVIVRAIGPSLNISGKLADPTLELRDADGALIRSNDNWRTDQEAEIIATTIPPSNDLESAIVQTLAPGNYTAILRGMNGTTGVGLVEAYGLN